MDDMTSFDEDHNENSSDGFGSHQLPQLGGDAETPLPNIGNDSTPARHGGIVSRHPRQEDDYDSEKPDPE